ncbi:hypothetical protein BIW11_05112 [Tropilaelaps mercedesae]|uniref:Uncharacterized protein n=1 Tax=Tropilaelaps mercedesae TaxID=418985 RepID=A0A1V9Y3M5_9ACAR|nr:hypothetical protein BIW11_05112 [Tropilaelaps mercedesae]
MQMWKTAVDSSIFVILGQTSIGNLSRTWQLMQWSSTALFVRMGQFSTNFL